jgi:signal transduction histidine kinase
MCNVGLGVTNTILDASDPLVARDAATAAPAGPIVVIARRSALVLIAVTAVFWAAHTRAAWRAADAQAVQMVSALARTMEFQAASIIRSIDSLLEEAAQRIDPTTWPDPVLAPWFISRMHAFPEASLMLVVQPDGHGTGLSALGLRQSFDEISDREYVQFHLRNPTDHGLHIGDPIIGRMAHRRVIPLSRAVFGDDGGIKGVVVVTIDSAFIGQALEKLLIEDSGGISLIRSDGIFLSRLPDPESSFGRSAAGSPLFQVELPKAKVGVARFVSVTDGQSKIVAYRTLDAYPLVATIGISDHTAFAGFWRETAWTTGLMLVICAALYWLATLSDRREQSRMILTARIEAQSHSLEHQVAERTFHLEVANSEVEDRVRQLAASNAELERFAYVASHDLKTPLRSIISYSQLLERRYRDRLDSDGVEFLAFIMQGGQRMSDLIDDLLDYAKISHPGAPPVAVAAEGALATALSNLSSEIAKAGAKITVGSLPIVLAAEFQLVMLFQNLVENAIKYRQPGRTVEITITAAQANPTEWQFAVADNGMGIDPEFFGKVFELFQRLQPAGRGEGTGIGLALCQNIVRRFGGTIWVDSNPGQGSTFFFTLRDGAEAP